MDDSGVFYLTGDQRKVYLTVLRLCFDFIKLVRLVIRFIYENMIIAFLFFRIGSKTAFQPVTVQPACCSQTLAAVFVVFRGTSWYKSPSNLGSFEYLFSFDFQAVFSVSLCVCVREL